MWPGMIIDGRSLAIVKFHRGTRLKATVLFAGIMEFDGQSVEVRDLATGKRCLLNDRDMCDLKPVNEECRIREIQSFDFFLERESLVSNVDSQCS